MAEGDGGPSCVEVDTSERLEEGSKSELERSASSTLVRRSSSMVQLGRATAEEASTGEALTADEELDIGYFGLTAADGSRVTPSLRRVLSARGQRSGVSDTEASRRCLVGGIARSLAEQRWSEVEEQSKA
jgi:hypothetical protein